MLYSTYQAQQNMLEPWRVMAEGLSDWLHHVLPDGPTQNSMSEMAAGGLMTRSLAAASEVMARLRVTHACPSFDLPTVMSQGMECGITEEAAMVTPFATLLRDTVKTLLQDHDVYITNWHNARDVPLRHGRFGLDEYTEHLIKFLDRMGPGSHLMAICQPCVASLAAASLMAQDGHPAQPRSLTLMAGPIDCRVNPTAVNELAVSKPMSWFESKMIHTVPLGQKGAFRKVYPGFVQLSAFLSMNMGRHIKAFQDMQQFIALGEHDKAAHTKAFYEEYFAVSDLPAEFYLETVRAVFQDYDLPRGELMYRGIKVEPQAIRRTALLTVEGERDDICAVGQTVAAQDLCTSVRPYWRTQHVQTGVGHYGVFSGRRWQNEIYPRVRDVIHQTAV